MDKIPKDILARFKEKQRISNIYLFHYDQLNKDIMKSHGLSEIGKVGDKIFLPKENDQ